jgi:hypothetical protein
MVVPRVTTTEFPNLESANIPAGSDPFVPQPSAPPGHATGDVPESSPPFLGRRSKSREGTSKDARPSRAPKPPIPPKSDAELKSGLEALYMLVSVALMPFDEVCATVFANNAEPAAKSAIELSKQNPAVRKFLNGLTQTSAWGGLIAAHSPIFMTISAHHFGSRRPNARVYPLHDDEPPKRVRHTGAAGGAVGKFCEECQNPVVPGVVHQCPEGA